jgi:probable blue pigment (indigoidine) exporter
MVAVFFYGLTEGTVQAGGGNTSVLANISPFFVVILGRLLLSERIAPLRATGLVIGFGGVVMMVWTQLGGAHARDLPLGLILGLAAALAWAVGTLLVKGSVARGQLLDFVGFTACQYMFGGIVLLAIAFAVDGTHGTDWGSLAVWGPLVYLVVGSAVGSLAYFAALKRLSATATTATLFLIPVVAVVVEIARGNAPTALVAVGMALAIAGVLLVNLPPIRIRSDAQGPHGRQNSTEPVA